MLRAVFLAAAALLSVFLSLPAAAQQPVQGAPSAALQNFVRDSFIFRLDDGAVPPGRARARAAALVAQAGGTLDFVYTVAYRGFSARMSSVAANNLFRNNDDVIGFSRDGIVTIGQASPAKGKPSWAGGGEEDSGGQQTPPGIIRIGGAGDGTGTTVWIIDTGVDLDHPDLNVDVARSVNFVLKGKNSPDDGNGHGTHVAGTVAALDNNTGVVGVAAGANVVAVRVLDNSGSGTYSAVIAGVDYVAANAEDGDVANMSLTGPADDTLDAAVIAAAENGVKFSLAAGNLARNANTRSPARVNHGNVYTVSAVDHDDVFAYFSNFGNPPVDYAAPGVGILSTWKGGGTKTISGTSMAAPHVAGILLLGAVRGDGTASGDPDGNPDPIAHR